MDIYPRHILWVFTLKNKYPSILHYCVRVLFILFYYEYCCISNLNSFDELPDLIQNVNLRTKFKSIENIFHYSVVWTLLQIFLDPSGVMKPHFEKLLCINPGVLHLLSKSYHLAKFHMQDLDWGNFRFHANNSCTYWSF